MGKTPTLVASGSVPLPPGAAKDSEIFDQDAVVLALRQLWSRTGIRNRHVVLGIGSRRVLVRRYTTAAMRPDLLKQALPFQVHDLLPVPPDQAVIDFFPVSEQDGQVSGLLVAAVAETVEGLIEAITKAKLTVDTVDLAPFGLARAAALRMGADEAVAALHLGDHTSYVVIIDSGLPRFVRIIPFDIATDAVRAREAMTAQQAESAPPAEATPPAEGTPPADSQTDDSADMSAMGDQNDEEPAAAARRSRGANRAAYRAPEMSASAIGSLVDRLRGTLAFYSERTGNRPLTRVALSGAGAAVPGVVEAIAANVDLPVEVIGATSLAPAGKKPPVGPDDLNLVTTLGIALGDVR